jgi:hypothetical protein
MRQVPQYAWPHGGYIQLLINVQERRKQSANLLFGKAKKHGSAFVLITDIEQDGLLAPMHNRDFTAGIKAIH